MSQLPPKPFNFEQQKAQGLVGEYALDAFFADRFIITEASDEQQRQGIDRIFWNRNTAETRLVEYKTGKVANRSQQAFIELETNGKGEASGWVYTSKAADLIYYVPGEGAEVAYWIRFSMLRFHLTNWLKRYRRISVPNENYDTVGILVPLSEFERIADDIACL